jgi:hypothetical protein
MAACGVESQRGRIGLSGFPLLQSAPGQDLSGQTGFDQLARHLADHPPHSGKGLLDGLDELSGWASQLGASGLGQSQKIAAQIPQTRYSQTP